MAKKESLQVILHRQLEEVLRLNVYGLVVVVLVFILVIFTAGVVAGDSLTVKFIEPVYTVVFLMLGVTIYLYFKRKEPAYKEVDLS